MTKDNLISLKKPEPFVDDPITEILRNGARKLLAQALATEVEIFISQYKDLKDELGRQRRPYAVWLLSIGIVNPNPLARCRSKKRI